MRDNSISNFRLLCIFLVTFAHNPFATAQHDFGTALPYVAVHSSFSYISFILFDGFSRISSPFLGYLSGYFVSSNLRDRSYLNVIARRFKSLYLPVVFWSIVMFAVMFVHGLATSDQQYLHHLFVGTDLDKFFGVEEAPLDRPTHYLVSLFKCVLIAPIMLYIWQRFGRGTFLILVALISLLLVGTDLNHDDPGLHLDGGSVLPRADMFLFFSLGFLSNRTWNFSVGEALERIRVKGVLPTLLLIIIFLIGTFHWRWLIRMSGDLWVWVGFFTLLLVRISGSLLILSSLPYLRKLANEGLYTSDRLAFNLFCTHSISFTVLQIALRWKPPELLAICSFFVAPFFATLAAAVVCRAERYAVKFSSRLSFGIRITGQGRYAKHTAAAPPRPDSM